MSPAPSPRHPRASRTTPTRRDKGGPRVASATVGPKCAFLTVAERAAFVAPRCSRRPATVAPTPIALAPHPPPGSSTSGEGPEGKAPVRSLISTVGPTRARTAPNPHRSEYMRHLLKLSLPAIAASLLIAACGSSSSNSTTSSAASTQPAAQTSSGSSSAVLVKSASNSLGTILVDSQGMTLYHLSGEQNGKFICTSSACVGVWHPLTVTSGAPGGEVASLGQEKRPDGTVQVTYKGTPLYTFASDHQPGEANGQGIKDVGTWSAVTTSAASAPASTSTAAEPESSSGGGSSGGGYGY